MGILLPFFRVRLHALYSVSTEIVVPQGVTGFRNSANTRFLDFEGNHGRGLWTTKSGKKIFHELAKLSRSRVNDILEGKGATGAASCYRSFSPAPGVEIESEKSESPQGRSHRAVPSAPAWCLVNRRSAWTNWLGEVPFAWTESTRDARVWARRQESGVEDHPGSTTIWNRYAPPDRRVRDAKAQRKEWGGDHLMSTKPPTNNLLFAGSKGFSRGSVQSMHRPVRDRGGSCP